MRLVLIVVVSVVMIPAIGYSCCCCRQPLPMAPGCSTLYPNHIGPVPRCRSKLASVLRAGAHNTAPLDQMRKYFMRDPTTPKNSRSHDHGPRRSPPHLSRSRPRFGCSAAAVGESLLMALPTPTSPRSPPWCNVDVLPRASSLYFAAAVTSSTIY